MAQPIYREGDLIFIPHEEDGFTPARAAMEFERGKPGKVRLALNDMEHSVSAKESASIERMDVQSFEDVKDMITLKVMNDASLLHNLRMRYTKERKNLPMKIYTNIGSILVSINPYKDLGLYTSEKEEAYLNSGANLSKLPPHVFKVAETAFQLLISEDKDQSCVITGESGAGKTEATKQFLQYISEKSRRNQTKDTGEFDTSNLRKKIMESNPFLEAFGNAKTLRNDNSSRFGKMLELYFDTSGGVIIGAKITNYLLEKSRVTLVQSGERNYHIFYQLCAASNSNHADFKKKYRLASADLFKYTMGANKQLSDVDLPDTNDAEVFKETLQAMKGMGMTEADLDATWKICAGILHLGNVEIVKDDKDFSMVGPEYQKTALKNAADMFEMEAAELEDAMLRHPTKDTFVAHSVPEAEAARDALAKYLYDKLFDHLISKMNAALQMSKKAKGYASVRMLGVLDIFGFETFEKNSFEQLCINFCNEKLQAFFNFHVFKKEQEEYAAEGINAAAVGFYDNQGVVDSIGDVGSKKKSKSLAIMSICDDQCLRGGMATDDSFLTAVLGNAKNLNDKNIDGHYVFKPKIQDIRKKPFLKNAFVIRHFAGDVAYNVEGFLEKNMDTLRENIRVATAKSSAPLVVSFFPEGGVAQAGRAAKYKKTLGNKFQFSLNRLMEQLDHTTPQFIRTIKPNELKEPGNFDAAKIFKQLREAGLLEVCKIRKLGYPIRKTHSQFMYDYLCIDKSGKDVADLCAKLEASGKLTYMDKEKNNPNWQIGKTKVFLRVEQANELEHMRADALKEVLAFLHRFGRKAVFRLRVKDALAAIKLLKKGQAEKNPEALQEGLDFFLSKGPLYSKLPIVLKGLELMKDLNVMLDVIKALEQAIEDNDMGTIKVKLEVAYGLNMSGHKVVKRAEEKLERHTVEKSVVQKLDAAIGTTNVKELAAAIEFAKENNFTDLKQYAMAERLLETLQKREDLLEKLRAALKNDASVDVLSDLVTQLREAGCPDGHYLIMEAVKKGELILEQNKKQEQRITVLEKQLKRAIKKRELKKLRDLVSAAIQLRYTGPLVTEAMQLISALEERQGLLDEVGKAARVLREKSKMPSGIVENDLKPLKHALKIATTGTELDLSNEIQVQEGEELIQHMLDQLKVQEDIVAALEKATPSSYYDVLEKVQRLGLQTREADEICQKVRELEMLKAKAEAITNEQIAEHTLLELRVPEEKERRKHLLRRAKCMLSDEFKKTAKKAAKSRDLSMPKYFKVRSDADFVAKEPRYAKEAKLQVKHVYSSEDPLSKSIIEMDDIQEHKAVQISQMILNFCDGLSGNKKDSMEAAMSFVVCHGIADQVLADEIYIQLARHLTANPNPLSKNKAWYLLCLCTTFFGVTERFLPYVLHFLQDSMSDAGLEGNYAKYSLAQLSSSQEIDPREVKYKPGSDEIKAFFSRPPTLAHIELVDRRFIEVPIPPDMQLRDLLGVIRAKTGIMVKLQNPEWAIYVKTTIKPPKLSYKVRLQNFYRKYKPENLANVDNLLDYYKGNEEALFAQLVEVGDYGPEPTPVLVGPEAKSKGNKKKKKKDRTRSQSGASDIDAAASGYSSTSKSSSFSAISFGSVASVFSAVSRVGKKLFKRARGLSTIDVTDLETPSPKIPWPLPWWVYPGDILGALFEQGRIPVLSYRRRVLKTKGKPDETLYLQLSRDFIDGYLVPYTEGENAKLSVMILAIRMIAAKKEFPYGDRNKLVKAGLLRCIPKTLKRAHAKDKAWLDAYLTVATEKSHDLKDYKDEIQIRQKFFEECVNFPTYGMSFFFGQLLKGNVNSYVARNQPLDEEDGGGMVKIGMSKREVALFKGGKKVRSFLLDDVVKYKCDGTTFTLEVKRQSQQREEAQMFEAQLRDRNQFGNQKSQLAGKPKRKGFKTLKNMVSTVASVFRKQTETFQVYTLQTREMYDVLYLFKKARRAKLD